MGASRRMVARRRPDLLHTPTHRHLVFRIPPALGRQRIQALPGRRRPRRRQVVRGTDTPVCAPPHHRATSNLYGRSTAAPHVRKVSPVVVRASIRTSLLHCFFTSFLPLVLFPCPNGQFTDSMPPLAPTSAPLPRRLK